MSFTFPEEFPDLHYSFDQPLSSEEYKYNGGRSPVFSFKEIDRGITAFNFNQPEFDNLHSKILFDKLICYSEYTYDELQNELNYDEHFHIYPVPSGKLRNLFNEWIGRKLRDEELPMIGQFALYTNPKGTDRNMNRKSPRIFFIVGRWAVFQILFFDPYHEIR